MKGVSRNLNGGQFPTTLHLSASLTLSGMTRLRASTGTIPLVHTPHMGFLLLQGSQGHLYVIAESPHLTWAW